MAGRSPATWTARTSTCSRSADAGESALHAQIRACCSRRAMTTTTEIAPDVYRISTYIPAANLQFNQFLVKDEQPLLFHTGMQGIFPEVREAVRRILDPKHLRWIGFSHFEADECGALN